jgi:hypothetical protein
LAGSAGLAASAGFIGIGLVFSCAKATPITERAKISPMQSTKNFFLISFTSFLLREN